MRNGTDPLVALGVGIGVGAAAIWAAVEFLPLLLIGGGVYLALKSKDSNTLKEGNINDNLDRSGE